MSIANLLWDYQKLDNLIDKFNKIKKESKSRDMLIKLKKYLLKQQEHLNMLNESITKKSSVYRKIEREVEDLSYNLKEDQEKLYSGDIKNIKQLEQLQRNAKNYRRRIELKEEELVKLIEEIQVYENDLNEIKTKIGKAKKEYVIIKEQYDKEVEKAEKEIDSVVSQRDKVQVKIDKELITKYETMKKHKKIVVAKIENEKCSGCNMSVPSVVINKVKTDEDIIECENCGRILCFD